MKFPGSKLTSIVESHFEISYNRKEYVREHNGSDLGFEFRHGSEKYIVTDGDSHYREFQEKIENFKNEMCEEYGFDVETLVDRVGFYDKVKNYFTILF